MMTAMQKSTRYTNIKTNTTTNKTMTKTNTDKLAERHYKCYIFEIPMTKASQVWWRIPPTGYHCHPSYPLDPLGHCWTHFMSHAQNSSFTGPSVSPFRDFVKWSQFQGWYNCLPLYPQWWCWVRIGNIEIVMIRWIGTNQVISSPS